MRPGFPRLALAVVAVLAATMPVVGPPVSASASTPAGTSALTTAVTRQAIQVRMVYTKRHPHNHCRRVAKVERGGKWVKRCIGRRDHATCQKRRKLHYHGTRLHRRCVEPRQVDTPPTGLSPHFGVAYGERLSWMEQDELDATLDDAVAMGITWIRIDLSWRSIERAGPGDWHWTRSDRVIAAAEQRGLAVLPILTYTPDWAKAPGCTAFGCPPADPTQFVSFARTAVERYQDRIDVWEVWNEPNLVHFWVQPDSAHYADLLRRTTAGIHEVDPGATVMFGGIAALEGSSKAIPPRRFLDEVCSLGGCKGIGAVSYHPYTFPFLASQSTPWDSAWSKMNDTKVSLRSILDKHGLESVRIWVTEYGAPTGGDGDVNGDGDVDTVTSETDHVTEAWQAAIASDAVRAAAANPDVAAVFWYTNQDIPWASGAERHFGLRREDGSKKPAWNAWSRAVEAVRAAAG